MSKKTQVKDVPTEDVSESALGVRRSSRISSNQTAVGSPIVKTITTRRSSASSTASKDLNGDSERISPIVEKRKTRRTSTDSDIIPTPIKTRRSSISKLIEEEKKTASSPGTPTRKSTRSMSRSPSSNVVDVPARRTRRSSQDTDQVIEQQPIRRSTRRRPSTDTQEEVTKEETVEVTKPVTRRRRSSSTDELESAKNDTKLKTKKLFSEDNQLEPIQEREAEQKEEPTTVNIIENKTIHELSIIQEAEDGDDESDKLIRDIDDVLANQSSSPKPKSAALEKVSSKSIFSPLTPKVKQGKEKEGQGIDETHHKDSPNKDADKITETETTKKTEEKRRSLKETEETSDDKSVENALDKSKESSEPKKFISEGSDDSFTLKLSLDKSGLDKSSMSKESQNDDDEVFSSPGSNKENSSVNIPSKNITNKQRDSLGKTKTIASPIITKAKRTSFYEAMDVDSDEFSNIQDKGKNETTASPVSKQSKPQENVQSVEDNIEIVEIDSDSNSSAPKKTTDVDVNNSFNRINSSQSDILNSSLNSINSPKKSSSTVGNISVSSRRDIEKDDSSSDISIKLVDSDEEIFEAEKTIPSPAKVEVKRSKRPRISDGTSKTILQRLQQRIDGEESISEQQETVQNSVKDTEKKEERKKSDDSMSTDKESEETQISELTNDEKSSNSSKSEETSNGKTLIGDVSTENKDIDSLTADKSKRKSMGSHNKEENEKLNKSASSDHSKENEPSTENNMNDPQSKDQIEAISPLKSKMDKMKDCGVNFLNPSPKVKLDAKTNSKLDEFLTKKLNDLADEDSSEDDHSKKKQDEADDGSMSEDLEKNEFIDDMAEEYEEDTPSEGSNDIIDEGESINSTESEGDSDESYDLEDSFIVDDSDEPELLEGDEYDLEIDADQSDAKKPKRKRILPKKDSTSEEESEQKTNNEDSEKLEKKKRKSTYAVDSPTITEKTDFEKSITEKSSTPVVKAGIPAIQISGDAQKRKLTYVTDSPTITEKTDFERSITEKSSTPVIKARIPSIRISGPAQTPDTVFEERIRSIVEPKINTPNNSFSEASNTPKLNNSARSSSIIIQENISINDMQSDLIADKLQQVVKVFCAGIRSSEGNVSMNVSLDFTENAPNASVSKNNEEEKVDNEENEPKVANISQMQNLENKSMSSKESPNLKKKRRSSHKRDQSLDQSKVIEPPSSQDEELVGVDVKTHDLSDLTKSKKQRRSSHKLNKSKEIEFSTTQEKESDLLETSAKSHNLSGQATKSKKNRRSSIKSDKQFNQSDHMEPTMDKESESLLMNDQVNVSPKSRKRRSLQQEEQEIENVSLSNVSNNEVEVSKTKKRRSSHKLKQMNTSGEIKEPLSSPSKTVMKKEEEEHSNYSIVEKLEPQTSFRNNDLNEENEKTTESEPEDKQTMKNKKKNRKRKTKSATNLEEPKQKTIDKRLKLLEMACEELPANDLRHKLLPSLNEYSNSTNTKTNKNRVKRLQSNLNMKYARLGELITDVKNRPRRAIKPSLGVENSGWIAVVDNVKPSVSNESPAFNYKAIDNKDFKNQMLYDPRVKRETTSKMLRNKGYYI